MLYNESMASYTMEKDHLSCNCAARSSLTAKSQLVVQMLLCARCSSVHVDGAKIVRLTIWKMVGCCRSVSSATRRVALTRKIDSPLRVVKGTDLNRTNSIDVKPINI